MLALAFTTERHICTSFLTWSDGVQMQGTQKVKDLMGGNKDTAEGAAEPTKEE